MVWDFSKDIILILVSSFTNLYSINMAEEVYDGAVGIDLGTTYSCVAGELKTTTTWLQFFNNV